MNFIDNNSLSKRNSLKTKNLLVVGYTFPPIPYSGTYRILRLCKGLNRLGAAVNVVTINIYKDIPNDDDILLQVPKSIKVYRTPIIDPWRRYQTWKTRNKNIPGFLYINKIVSFFLRFVTIPDHMILWIPFAIVAGVKIIKQRSIDAIFVSSPPYSAQLIGLFLKKITKVKWLVDLRDPIVGNVAEVHLLNPTDIISKIEKKVRVNLEKLIAQNSDIIIANTDTHRIELSNKYKSGKFYTIKNSYDEDDYKNIKISKTSKFIISHVGSMYGLRKADILLNVIKTLEKEISPKPLNLEVHFLGLNDITLEKDVINRDVTNYVQIRNLVPHHEAMKAMINSHLLLLIKANAVDSLGQIPGKFYEYLGIGKPILYLGPQKCELADMIRDLNAGYIVDNNEKMLIRILKDEYAKFLQGIYSKIELQKVSKYNNIEMAKRVLSLVGQ